jgi:hypothetical protein
MLVKVNSSYPNWLNGTMILHKPRSILLSINSQNIPFAYQQTVLLMPQSDAYEVQTYLYTPDSGLIILAESFSNLIHCTNGSSGSYRTTTYLSYSCDDLTVENPG